jgi:dephospho-CoA kinase
MALILLTGVGGTGKTLVCNALKERGYEAYDTDDDGLARWQNIRTGYIHPKSSVKSEQRTPQFLKDHKWVVPRQVLEEIAQNTNDKTVFISGSLGNEDALRDIFSNVIALYVDNETLKHRLLTRDHSWGKSPHELQLTLEHNENALARYAARQYTIIDANLPPTDVVYAVLAAVA